MRPELLADLTERYRRLGIEESNPLNEITERTRAALEAELGLPVFTGMKHWRLGSQTRPRRRSRTGADTVVGLVLAPHYSRLSIGGYRQQLEDALAGRAGLEFVDSWHLEPGFVELLADRVRGTSAHVVFTAHSLPARILAEGDPYQDQLLETSRSIAQRAALRGLVFQLPVRIADRRAVARARHPRPPRRRSTRGASTTCSSVRSASSPTTSRSAGTSTPRRTRRRDELGMRLARIEMPNDDPAFVATLATIVRRALAVPSTA